MPLATELTLGVGLFSYTLQHVDSTYSLCSKLLDIIDDDMNLDDTNTFTKFGTNM